MAVDTQTIEMSHTYVPFERPPQPYTLWTAIPRGLTTFFVDAQVLDAKALNDDAILRLTATLQPNFGYVFADWSLQIDQDRAADWGNQATVNFQSFLRIPGANSVALQMTWFDDFSVHELSSTSKVVRHLNRHPSFPMINTAGDSGIRVTLGAFNAVDTAALAGVVNAFATFWQFDLEQIQKYPVNMAVHTIHR